MRTPIAHRSIPLGLTVTLVCYAHLQLNTLPSCSSHKYCCNAPHDQSARHSDQHLDAAFLGALEAPDSDGEVREPFVPVHDAVVLQRALSILHVLPSVGQALQRRKDASHILHVQERMFVFLRVHTASKKDGQLHQARTLAYFCHQAPGCMLGPWGDKSTSMLELLLKQYTSPQAPKLLIKCSCLRRCA